MPKVSVIIPTYNRADLIQDSIDSVLWQTFEDYEIIIVDDGSTDNTREVLHPLIQEGVIRYVRQDNQGESAARNHGIKLARGDLVAFLDSDDLFLPEKLAKQISLLEENPALGMVHSDFVRFDHDTGVDLGYRSTAHLSGWVYPQMLLQWSVLIATPTVMIPKEVLEHVGGFDERMHWAEDIDLWRRIARLYPIQSIPEALTRVRTHQDSLASDRSQSFTAFRDYLQKAMDEDPDLGWSFRRRAWAKLYSNAGHNLLGTGTRQQMGQVRAYCAKAIAYWPLALGAYWGYLGSYLGAEIRSKLLRLWRTIRYRGAE